MFNPVSTLVPPRNPLVNPLSFGKYLSGFSYALGLIDP